MSLPRCWIMLFYVNPWAESIWIVVFETFPSRKWSWGVHTEVWEVEQIVAAVLDTPVELTKEETVPGGIQPNASHAELSFSLDWSSPAWGHIGVWTPDNRLFELLCLQQLAHQRQAVPIGGGQNDHLSWVLLGSDPAEFHFLSNICKPAIVSITHHCFVLD